MKANIRFSLWWFVRSMGVIGVFFGLYLLFLIFAPFEGTGEAILDFFVKIGTLLACLFPSAWFLEGKHLAFSMGNTRKQFFLQSQVHKAIAVLVVTVCSLIVDDFASAFSTISSAFFIACISEMVGILCVKLGKYGLIIFIIISGLIGAMFGIWFVSHDLGTMVLSINFLKTYLQAVIGIVAGLGLTWASWLMFRKMDM